MDLNLVNKEVPTYSIVETWMWIESAGRNIYFLFY